MKIKLLNGVSVRTGPDNPDGSVPSRRDGEKGDVLDVGDVPEWKGEVPEWLIEQGHVEVVDDDRKKKPVKAKVEEN
jgi:hypothetical protein